ncbi:uncharacterized protein LOC115882219 [Sitophilus oryzae]|uniref:Uncharacterized protein LOC115882219 n=1 Tax=Sitophilus oryzae TaxID=7048 RepID=A0A6J2XYZ6_SITOR|nr:uncharacterized protein LOC115882219 [Sitophilus oryzae]
MWNLVLMEELRRVTNINIKDPKFFLKRAFKSFSLKIKKELKQSLLKVNAIFSANFVKPHTAETDVKTFLTKNEIIDNTTNLKYWYKKNIEEKILAKLENFQERDSGWALFQIIHLKININQFNPISVSSSTYVDLPNFIKKTKAVINIKNNDEYCFLWSIVCALYPAPSHKNSSATSSYPHFTQVQGLHYYDITFPIGLKDISKFEKMNSISINVYTFEKKEIFPVSLTKTDFELKINLLIIPCDAFLKMTNTELELLTDPDMLCLLNEVYEGEFHNVRTDMEKQIISLWGKNIILTNQFHI